MEINHSYIVRNITVRAFQNVKYLSSSQATKIIECEDIPDVVTSTFTSNYSSIMGEIAGCGNLMRYKSCLLCNSNVKLNTAELIAQNSIKCSNCSAILKLSHCPTQFAAKIVIIGADDSSNPRKASLQIFTEQLMQLTDMPLSNLLDISDDEITAAVTENDIITAYYQGNSIKEIKIH